MRHLPPEKTKLKKKARSPDKGSLLLDEEELHMNEQAIMAMMKMLDYYENVPRSDWPRHEAEEIAFSRCTLEEVLTQVWDHPWTPASETIERFAFRMKEYEATAVTDGQRRIFSVAAECAWDLLDMVIELEK